MPNLTCEQLTQEIGGTVAANVNLAQFSTFKLGGPAEFFVRAKTAEIFKKAIIAALAHNLPYTILGGGANILIADQGIKGLVIRAENNDIAIEGELVRAGAGAPFAQTAIKSAQAALTGLEFAAAVPGSVGGATRGNAGCYGSEIKDVLSRVHVLRLVIASPHVSFRVGSAKQSNNRDKDTLFANKIDRVVKIASSARLAERDGLPRNDSGVEDLWLSNADCQFAYRESRFKREPFIILEAEFKLSPGNKEDSMAKITKLLQQKKITQSVESNCAGCVFKNVPWSEWEKIPLDKLKSEDIDDASQFKAKGFIPSGWLIEQLGLKGYRIGDAMVSEKHGNFLLNMSKATTSEMIQLISYIKMQARDRLGLMLQEEVQYLGF